MADVCFSQSLANVLVHSSVLDCSTSSEKYIPQYLIILPNNNNDNNNNDNKCNLNTAIKLKAYTLQCKTVKCKLNLINNFKGHTYLVLA